MRRREKGAFISHREKKEEKKKKKRERERYNIVYFPQNRGSTSDQAREEEG